MAKQMMSKEKNVKAQAPHLVAAMKWGNVCWVGAGNVCRKATDIRPRALAGVLASAVALDGAGFTPAKASSRR